MEQIRQDHWIDGYIGTYASEQSRGVYHFRFHEKNGDMTEPELFYEAPNAKWVSLYRDRLMFPVEKNGKAGTCFLELEKGDVKNAYEIYEETKTPCYIQKDGAYTYTANYHEGTVMVYQDDKKAPVTIERIENGIEAGCHQILLHGPYLMVPCLTQHRIRMFDRENGYTLAEEITFPDGSGPRHGVFNRRHTRLYVVSEWSNELFIFAVRDREFTLVQTLPILAGTGIPEEQARRTITPGIPEEQAGRVISPGIPGVQAEGEEAIKPGIHAEGAAAAAVRLTSDERYLYISVRGANLLVLVDVSTKNAVIKQYASSQGDHPRDFILAGQEHFLLTANRLSGGITSIERDTGSGKIGAPKAAIRMPETVSLVLAK